MQLFLLVSTATFFVAVIYASFFEWLLHKYVMHLRIPGFEYPFRAHAMVHHHIFKADHTYHLIDEKDKWTIPMAWWNGPALVVISALPFAAVSALLGTWAVVAGAVLALGGYYGMYEWLHWCMHLPKARRVEKMWIFYRLNGHHLLHHRYMRKNFNVVCPLADLCLRTLMLRSKLRFAQATGPSVPDVQPRTGAEPPVTSPALDSFAGAAAEASVRPGL
jgi:hypothetical protein